MRVTTMAVTIDNKIVFLDVGATPHEVLEKCAVWINSVSDPEDFVSTADNIERLLEAGDYEYQMKDVEV